MIIINWVTPIFAEGRKGHAWGEDQSRNQLNDMVTLKNGKIVRGVMNCINF